MHTRRLVIQPQILLAVVLGYPLLYMVPYVDQDIGYVLDNVVLLPLATFIGLLAAAQGHHIIKRANLGIYAGFIVMLVLVAMNSADLRYGKALLTITSLFLTFHLVSGMQHRDRDRVVGYILLLYLVASVVAMAMPSRFANLGRFSGFTLTPTVFSVYLEAILIVFLFTQRPAWMKVAATLAITVFVILSGTRLNVLFLAGLPFLVLAVRWMPRYRGLLQVVILVMLNLLYPAYALFTQSTGQAITAGRGNESDGDTSFALRFALFTTLATEFATSTTREKLTGQGAGASRKLLEESYDVMPHNDFLRFAVDFGVPALLVYLALLYRIGARTVRSFLLLNLYFVAFYHNMIYSYYLLFLVVYYALRPEPESKPPELTASSPTCTAPA